MGNLHHLLEGSEHQEEAEEVVINSLPQFVPEQGGTDDHGPAPWGTGVVPSLRVPIKPKKLISDRRFVRLWIFLSH